MQSMAKGNDKARNRGNEEEKSRRRKLFYAFNHSLDPSLIVESLLGQPTGGSFAKARLTRCHFIRKTADNDGLLVDFGVGLLANVEEQGGVLRVDGMVLFIAVSEGRAANLTGAAVEILPGQHLLVERHGPLVVLKRVERGVPASLHLHLPLLPAPLHRGVGRLQYTFTHLYGFRNRELLLGYGKAPLLVVLLGAARIVLGVTAREVDFLLGEGFFEGPLLIDGAAGVLAGTAEIARDPVEPVAVGKVVQVELRLFFAVNASGRGVHLEDL